MFTLQKFIPVFSACIFLGGCSTTSHQVPLDLRPGQGLEEQQLHLRAIGTNRFQCVKDDQGYYWKFDSASAKLGDSVPKNDKDIVATMRVNGNENYFIHKDGSSLFSQKIDKIKKSYSPNKHLSHARFRITNRSSKGEFSGVRYVLRVNTKYGMPFIPCDPGNYGDFHDVKFTATYVFWR